MSLQEQKFLGTVLIRYKLNGEYIPDTVSDMKELLASFLGEDTVQRYLDDSSILSAMEDILEEHILGVFFDIGLLNHSFLTRWIHKRRHEISVNTLFPTRLDLDGTLTKDELDRFEQALYSGKYNSCYDLTKTDEHILEFTWIPSRNVVSYSDMSDQKLAKIINLLIPENLEQDRLPVPDNFDKFLGILTILARTAHSPSTTILEQIKITQYMFIYLYVYKTLYLNEVTYRKVSNAFHRSLTRNSRENDLIELDTLLELTKRHIPLTQE